MFHIDKRSYSIKDVADYLRVPERMISVHYSKDQNNPSKPLHVFYDSIREPENGRLLKSTKGYYYSDGRGSEECVYAEYEDDNGRCFSYVRHPGSSIASQIQYDKENSKYKSNQWRTPMDNLTKLDYKSLVEFNDSLDEFLKKVTHACDKMESGISFCKGYMQDDPSAQILRESNHVVNQIRECINPTRKVQEKIVDIISLLESGCGV